MASLYIHFLLFNLCLAFTRAGPALRDNMDVHKFVGNGEALNGFLSCMMNKGPCAPDYQDFKDHLPTALQNRCSDCSAAEKAFYYEGALMLMKKRPREWQIISDMYNPGGVFTPGIIQGMLEYFKLSKE